MPATLAAGTDNTAQLDGDKPLSQRDNTTGTQLNHPHTAPDATDEDRPWKQILLAVAIQGAIFAMVKASVDRSGAVAIRRLTGTWPG
ncbi:DUF4235 domain-containing protein [Streptomyces sp. NPDC058613]|uniref:DUF4235 domain-containing protein n=1 Tax=Streptomyces sp. NPDC058613 TaxID=3346556 RepID=UPI00365C81FE